MPFVSAFKHWHKHWFSSMRVEEQWHTDLNCGFVAARPKGIHGNLTGEPGTGLVGHQESRVWDFAWFVESGALQGGNGRPVGESQEHNRYRADRCRWRGHCGL